MFCSTHPIWRETLSALWRQPGPASDRRTAGSIRLPPVPLSPPAPHRIRAVSIHFGPARLKTLGLLPEPSWPRSRPAAILTVGKFSGAPPPAQASGPRRPWARCSARALRRSAARAPVLPTPRKKLPASLRAARDGGPRAWPFPDLPAWPPPGSRAFPPRVAHRRTAAPVRLSPPHPPPSLPPPPPLTP